MREIKFRAWDKSDKKMVSSDDMENQAWNIYGSMRNPENSDWSYMQYTGLKDKNDKEIYEGDIVGFELYNSKLLPSRPYQYTKATIEWCNSCCFGFRAQWHEWANNVRLSDINEEENELTIIGNIYENKELLK